MKIQKGNAEFFAGPEPGSVIVRIDDDDNPAFWIDLLLTKDDLNELQLKAMEATLGRINMPDPPDNKGETQWQAGLFK